MHAVIVINITKNAITKVIQDVRIYLEKEMLKFQYRLRHQFLKIIPLQLMNHKIMNLISLIT